MGGTAKLWLFILLLPFFAAIGHDFYVNYMADPQKKARLEALDIDPEAYQISDAGYLLVTHAPSLYENMRTTMGEESWKTYMDPVLQQYTFVLALIPPALFIIYLMMAWITGLPPYRGQRLGKPINISNKYDGVFKDHDKENRLKYKRR